MLGTMQPLSTCTAIQLPAFSYSTSAKPVILELCSSNVLSLSGLCDAIFTGDTERAGATPETCGRCNPHTRQNSTPPFFQPNIPRSILNLPFAKRLVPPRFCQSDPEWRRVSEHEAHVLLSHD